MATVQEQQDVLRQMILSFRVNDLQVLLSFAGKNRQGRKEELLSRALDLVKLRSVPLQAKIREIYKASQEAQQQSTMMGGGGQPINPYAATNGTKKPGDAEGGEADCITLSDDEEFTPSNPPPLPAAPAPSLPPQPPPPPAQPQEIECIDLD